MKFVETNLIRYLFVYAYIWRGDANYDNPL